MEEFRERNKGKNLEREIREKEKGKRKKGKKRSWKTAQKSVKKERISNIFKVGGGGLFWVKKK